VAALDFHRDALVHRESRPEFHLDGLGRPFTDEQVVRLLDVLNQRIVHLVAGHADGLAVDDARKRNHGDVGGAAADVDDHVARSFLDGHAGADGGGHGFLHEVDLTGLGAIRAVLDGAFFDLRDFRRDADDDAGPHPHGAVVRLLDEVRQHLFRDLEVGDDAVLHRFDGDDVAGRAPEHFLGFLADRLDTSGDLVDGHDRRLVDDDTLATRVHAGVGGAKVDGEVARKKREERTKRQLNSCSPAGILTPASEPAI
jgi:hypothetical protein